MDGVTVARDKLLATGIPKNKIAAVIDVMKMMSCAEIIGYTQAVLEMTIDYCKSRMSLNRPIGTFQSVHLKLAEMSTSVEASRLMVDKVAWMIDHGVPCSKESAIARLQTAQTCDRVIIDAIHLHGAVALVQDHDLSLYFKRAKAAQLNLGTTDCDNKIILEGIGV